MNFILEFCAIGLFSSSSIVSGTCVFDREPVAVSAVRDRTGVVSIASKESEFFDRVLDFSRRSECALVTSYGGEVLVGNKSYPLLGSEYVCRDSQAYLLIESGGPHLFAKVSRLR